MWGALPLARRALSVALAGRSPRVAGGSVAPPRAAATDVAPVAAAAEEVPLTALVGRASLQDADREAARVAAPLRGMAPLRAEGELCSAALSGGCAVLREMPFDAATMEPWAERARARLTVRRHER